MPSNFPTALDTFDCPPGNPANAAQAAHRAQHCAMFDAIAAIQARIGVADSQDPQSLEARIGALEDTVPGGNGDPSAAWPVGSVFLSVVNTNPATLLGFGTWAALAAGRMLVGFDAADPDFDAAKKIGGAKTHTLSVQEMPSHTHVQNAHNHTQQPHTHVQNPHNHVIRSQTATTGSATSYEHGALDTSSAETEATEVTDVATATNQNATAVNDAATATNQNTGGGAAHNNLPPYLVVFAWERTA